MYILEYDDYTISPTQEAFLIRPIRNLFNKDRTKNKDKFMTQMSILYFVSDPRSSYAYILDEKERLAEVLRQEGLPKNYKLDPDLISAIEEYKKHVKTTSSELIDATRLAIKKLSEYLSNIDFNAEDDKGKPKYTISNITSALKQIPDLLEQLNTVEKKLKAEIEETEARGSAEKGIMADGLFRIK